MYNTLAQTYWFLYWYVLTGTPCKLRLGAHCVTTIELLRPNKAVYKMRFLLSLPLWLLKLIPYVLIKPIWDDFYRFAEENIICYLTSKERMKFIYLYQHDCYVIKWGWILRPTDEWFSDNVDDVPLVEADAFINWYAYIT